MISIARSDHTTATSADQVERRARDALARREALPSCAACVRRPARVVVRHWNSLRIQPDRISPTMTIAMIAITMVSTKS